MGKRTFGWVQNPGSLKTLKNVVGIFYKGSCSHQDLLNNRLPLILKNSLIEADLYDDFIEELQQDDLIISYAKLKGKGCGKLSRSQALCSGIIQAAIDAQSDRNLIDLYNNLTKMKKPYVDDWTSDGYLRWAISTGLLIYDSDTDTCKISALGIELVNTEPDSTEEKEALTKALLAYPPVIRVLQILSGGEALTKFEIGRNLGFRGEMGFTSIPQNMFLAEYCTSADKSKVRSNVEGDSDKYARGIASWLTQMDWVKPVKKNVTETYYDETFTEKLQAYRITVNGEKALKRAFGNSSNAKIPRIVMFEMLATKVPNADYIRLRRASIIKSLTTSYKSIAQIQTYLQSLKLKESEEAIKDDIENLSLMGIAVSVQDDKYKITDKIISLNIPTVSSIIKEDITELKDTIRGKLKHVDHKYLVLVDLAYSDADSRTKKNADARDFEIQTASLFTEELDFNGERLGDSNKPDVIISYDNFGTIIDNKSYKDGFNVDRHCSDEMSRYIEQNSKRQSGVPANEWWRCFDSSVTDFTFMFVTSYLKGNFRDNLKYISDMRSIPGGAIGVESLLYLAESLKSGAITYSSFFDLFVNDEIVVTV